MQLSFSTTWTGHTTDAEAKAARDAKYRELKKDPNVLKVRRSVLKNQLRKWAGLGQPDGRVCDVYMIDYTTKEDVARFEARQAARTTEGRMRDAFNGRV